MVIQHGDRVLVEGYRGRRGVLRVWKVMERGMQLCSEERFARLQPGEIPPTVGFPMADIKGLAPEAGGLGP